MSQLNLLKSLQLQEQAAQKPKKYDFSSTALLALLLALVLAQIFWLSMDQRPPAWDESIHYMGAHGYSQILQQGGPGVFSKLLYQSDFYPPLAEFATGCLFLAIGPHPQVAAYLNLAYLAGIILIVFLMGRDWFGKEAGILAGYLFAASSVVGIQSKLFMLDLPLTFFVMLGCFALLRSESLTRLRWALVYGLAFGLGMLVKWSALFFFLPMPLILGVASFWQEPARRNQIIRGVLLALLLAGVLCLPWYGVHLIKLVKNTSGYIHDRGVLENDPPLTSPLAWVYYIGSLLQDTSWLLGLGLLTGVAWFFVSERHEKNTGLMALWLALPYLILTLIRNKDHRYFIPFLPIICLLGVAWLRRIRSPLRQELALGLALLCLAQMAYVHMGERAGSAYFFSRVKLLGIPLIQSQGPQAGNWPQAAILADVEELGKTRGHQPQLRVIPDHASFSKVTFVVAQTQQKTDVGLAATSDWPLFTEYAITKTGSQGLAFNSELPQKITDGLSAATKAENPRFAVVREYPLPDGSQARLYERREILNTLPAPEIMELLQQQIKTLLADYIRSAEKLEVVITPYSEMETRLGHWQKVSIQSEQGQVGDFKHKPFGLPFASLDLEIRDLWLDLPALQSGQLVPYWIGDMKVHRLIMRAEGLNEALNVGERDLKPLRVSFQNQRLAARYLSKWPLEVVISLASRKDPHHPGSDNLFFTLEAIRVKGISLPGFLLQPLVRDFNPLLRLAGFPGQITLGKIQLADSELKLGTEIKLPRAKAR